MIEATVFLAHPKNGDRHFIAETASGHRITLDDSQGGRGAKPIELVAVALAGCTAFDVITILRKKRQIVTAYEVRIEADQADLPPPVFNGVRIRHKFTGDGIDAHAVREAIRLSEEKYCSVGAMIRRSAAITTSFEIIDTSGHLTTMNDDVVLAPSGR